MAGAVDDGDQRWGRRVELSVVWTPVTPAMVAMALVGEAMGEVGAWEESGWHGLTLFFLADQKFPRRAPLNCFEGHRDFGC